MSPLIARRREGRKVRGLLLVILLRVSNTGTVVVVSTYNACQTTTIVQNERSSVGGCRDEAEGKRRVDEDQCSVAVRVIEVNIIVGLFLRLEPTLITVFSRPNLSRGTEQIRIRGCISSNLFTTVLRKSRAIFLIIVNTPLSHACNINLRHF